MKAEKFIESMSFERDAKKYEEKIFEVRDVDISEDDWEFLSDKIFDGDLEQEAACGLYSDEFGYIYLDCDKVLEAINDWKEELEGCDSNFSELLDSIQEHCNKIEQILAENEGFTIWYD